MAQNNSSTMTKDQIIQLAMAADSKYGLPPGTMAGLIQQESGFNPKAKSGAGAVGLTQIVPKWHPSVDQTKLTSDPAYAIEQGARILSSRVKARKGDLGLALADYNGGQGNVNSWMKNGNWAKETQEYVPRVMANAARYGGGSFAAGTTAFPFAGKITANPSTRIQAMNIPTTPTPVPTAPPASTPPKIDVSGQMANLDSLDPVDLLSGKGTDFTKPLSISTPATDTHDEITLLPENLQEQENFVKIKQLPKHLRDIAEHNLVAMSAAKQMQPQSYRDVYPPEVVNYFSNMLDQSGVLDG